MYDESPDSDPIPAFLDPDVSDGCNSQEQRSDLDLTKGQSDKLDLEPYLSNAGTELEPSQTGLECKDQSADLGPLKAELENTKAQLLPIVYTIIPADPNAPQPQIKRYAHHGKRRRSITEDLFRCTFVTKVVSDELTCGALLWKNRPSDLRSHLLNHIALDIVKAMSDDQVLQSYTDAKRIFLERLPDDVLYGIEEEDLDEEDDLGLEEKESEDKIDG